MKEDMREKLQISRYFSAIYRRWRIINDRDDASPGLSAQQQHYLREIYLSPGISQEELAEKYGADKGAVARAVRKMMDGGYVRREKNEEDRRAYRLYPTVKAEDMRKAFRKHMMEMEEGYLSGLDEGERDELCDLLSRVMDNMEKMMKEERS